MRIVYLAQLTLGAGVVAATLLQFVGALCVREYARVLWRREIRDEVRVLETEVLCVEKGAPLQVIFEEEGKI